MLLLRARDRPRSSRIERELTPSLKRTLTLHPSRREVHLYEALWVNCRDTELSAPKPSYSIRRNYKEILFSLNNESFEKDLIYY
ncbi:hypothetical protein TNCT_718491 [Trichonephila clavata]|uniref:Uncharacterized protein n=1 Tax=Trichonephila clavata TaxID=2740835 RepID=A0A8X6KW25_TRICU|nr:hypothetical protein TNCT_718491 [Trichonephila clavata]